MRGAPDGVLMVQVAVTVENVPIVPEPATEYPIDGYGKATRTSATLATLKSWTITADRVGILRTIEIACSNSAVGQFKITVAGKVVFTTNLIPESFSAEFPDIHLSAGQEVLIQYKSDGSTSLTGYCWITGKEVG